MNLQRKAVSFMLLGCFMLLVLVSANLIITGGNQNFDQEEVIELIVRSKPTLVWESTDLNIFTPSILTFTDEGEATHLFEVSSNRKRLYTIREVKGGSLLITITQ